MDRLEATARTLGRDKVAVEVTTALAAAGVRAVLLKGPAIATWLYGDGALRYYGDIDLLVAPDQLAAAEDVLGALGFARAFGGWSTLEVPGHAHSWVRSGEAVDLHHRLPDVGAAPADAWRRLSAGTEVLRLGGGEVEVLGLPARTLHLALHAACNGERGTRSRTDLVRATTVVPLETWREAAALAEALDAEDAFVAGLRLDPAPAAMADTLGLAARPSLALRLQVRGSSQATLGLLQFAGTPGWRAKAALALRRVVPTPAWLRDRYPLARWGRMGLAGAYVWRAASVVARAPAALIVIGRERRRR